MKKINYLFILIFVCFFVTIIPLKIHAETISLHKFLDRLGLQPTILELDHIKKGGSVTAVIIDTSALAALGFQKLKTSNLVHLQNLGNHYWMVAYPPSRQKAKILISRQNKPAKKPRIRVKLIHLTPSRHVQKK